MFSLKTSRCVSRKSWKKNMIVSIVLKIYTMSFNGLLLFRISEGLRCPEYGVRSLALDMLGYVVRQRATGFTFLRNLHVQYSGYDTVPAFFPLLKILLVHNTFIKGNLFLLYLFKRMLHL
jgi:hypothetical protein